VSKSTTSRWLALVAVNAIAVGVLGFYSTSGAAPNPQAGQPPFNNAVDQREGMLRELREIKELLKEQNSLLRGGAGKPNEQVRR
jgi:hypothetical protein